MSHRRSVEADYFAIPVAERPLAQQVIYTDIADYGFSIPETGRDMRALPNDLSFQDIAVYLSSEAGGPGLEALARYGNQA